MPFSDSILLSRPLSEPEPVRHLQHLLQAQTLQNDEHMLAAAMGQRLVGAIRDADDFSTLERFLSHVGLDSCQGQALMLLAEGILRVPDRATQIALIEDCLGSCDWSRLTLSSEQSGSSLFRLGGRLLPALAHWNQGASDGVSRDLIRRAVRQGVKLLGGQFVIGADIQAALSESDVDAGYCYSYDMLGEAALTAVDADRYFDAYLNAIEVLGRHAESDQVNGNPAVSVKLSALSPRYQRTQRQRVLEDVVPRVAELAQRASQYQLGLTLDAEESDRLELQLDVLEGVLAHLHRRVPSSWDGLGMAVQAYGLRAAETIDWLHRVSLKYGRKLAVRLVKGAYWDAEIKRAQVLGVHHYPVLTRKSATDASYLCCAERLLACADRLYPQFATHNAHTVAAIHTLSLRYPMAQWEYQRLYGMGRALYDLVLSQDDFSQGRGHAPSCRVYAPVGRHDQLLAYLVRRLLENGANTSFVHQLANPSYALDEVVANPLAGVSRDESGRVQSDWESVIPLPDQLYGAHRVNARGFDLGNEADLSWLETKRSAFKTYQWDFSRSGDGEPGGVGAEQSVGADPSAGAGQGAGAEQYERAILTVRNPSNPHDVVGKATVSTRQEVRQAVANAVSSQPDWCGISVSERANRLRRYSNLLEEHTPELLALLARESGKTLPDAIAEIREAVDFARYYAEQAEQAGVQAATARGVFVCISPWNFPLAIFSGQILAALVAGNAVVAKAAEQTPLMACRAVALMHQAGIPDGVLQLLTGQGETVGEWLMAEAQVDGVCFTGSLETARRIHQYMALYMPTDAPLMAETGGINAMVVDSTALPEQVVRDVLVSAFQSAGQRCSALRVLYVQQDIADKVLSMLYGAMDELVVGDAWALASDVGPVVDQEAQGRIHRYVQQAEQQGRLLKRGPVADSSSGWFVSPVVLAVQGIDDVEQEVFGPVLHVATFAAGQLDGIVEAIHRRGYGLTFAVHTRIRQRAHALAHQVCVGNCYINRNQVGAVVGSQPFGGEGLSGTGPKAGGPHYLRRFLREQGRLSREQDQSALAADWQKITGGAAGSAFGNVSCQSACDVTGGLNSKRLQSYLDALPNSMSADQSQLTPLATMLDQRLPERSVDHWTTCLPGPTGELNALRVQSRGKTLCLASRIKPALMLALAALRANNPVLLVVGEAIPPSVLEMLKNSRLAIIAVQGWVQPDALVSVSGVELVSAHRGKTVNGRAVNGKTDHVADEAESGDTYLRAIRQGLSRRAGKLVPLLVDETNVIRYQHERHVCTDVTAVGGNIQLLSHAH